ncbi:MAG: hypothetical protein IM558_00845 [Chitinophagaceae bacterium]|nr:hypothetical protein [Chitinophagaceae bacterium]
MKYKNIREEELKNKVGADWFKSFDTTEIIGNIDFTAFPKQSNIFGRSPLLWAEAKTGNFDIPIMFVQLILTIGKARTFDKTLPPAFLGAFDFKKIAFVPYINVQDIFYLNDFNWNVTPSNHDTKEFKLIKERIEANLRQNSYVYDYIKDEKELKYFIANNISKATETSKIKIDKNNFIPIYLRWLDIVKPIIDVNWEVLKKASILDSDFYLADLFVDDKDTNKIDDDSTIRESLFVIFQNQGYKIAKENIKQMFDATINIKAKDTYQQFWKRYKRPPVREFQEYIIERRDLLVPQDIRERKGAFFTPRIWVELSQKYLAESLGEDWQEEYYIWDCACGTGNLLAGLTNKYNIWASTLDQADISVIHERIKHGANLLDDHVFQFDFLNDDFSKLPRPLQDIINNPEKRKKLVIYINPPYAEAGDAKQRTGTGKNKASVSHNKIHDKYHDQLGDANRQLFAQFLIRIYNEIEDCKIAEFSTLKTLTSSHFGKFRDNFKAKHLKVFIVPADSFDNVKGQFPIGFKIWDSERKEKFDKILVDVFNENQENQGLKLFSSLEGYKYFSSWVNTFKLKSGLKIGWLQGVTRNDFQNQTGIIIKNEKVQIAVPRGIDIYDKNLVECCVCYAVRMCIPADWLNDCDQFLFPNLDWVNDNEFKNNCLVFTLFHDKNTIQSKFGTNNWIPFTEQEINSREKFESNFMSKFINGKLKKETNGNLFGNQTQRTTPLAFSTEATVVLDSARQLWKYYHRQPNCNVNASLYDIREHFQGRNDAGKMNNKSSDETYMALIGDLREKLRQLADKIEPKVYEYEFLKL